MRKQTRSLQIKVTRNDKNWNEIDDLCYKSKNLYNTALYIIRQHYFDIEEKIKNGEKVKDNKYLNYYAINQTLKDKNDSCYRSLPAKTSQQTLKLLDQNFKSFFNANKDYKVNPNKYLGRPKIPKYKDKEGRYVVKYTYQGISKPKLKEGYIKLEKSNLCFDIRKFSNVINENSLCEVRLIPKPSCYIVEIIYEIDIVDLKEDNGRYASIDLGVSNLCTISSNTSFQSTIMNGKPLKSINQFYNKRKAHYQSRLKVVNNKLSSKRLDRLVEKRNNKVKDYLHKASHKIVNYLVSSNINTLVIGYNKEWKQNTKGKLSKKVNQNFISIPYLTLINMLKYKCDKEGIRVILKNESFTSKCSFLDNEKICRHSSYLGNRKERGLFISSKGYLINADVNGSLNILRNAIPNAFNEFLKDKGIEGFVVNPVIVNV